MKYKWLNRQNNNKLIIFFNGWGMDEKVVNHLEFDEYDVVMFYDYRTLDSDLEFINNYPEVKLISWSMGVMISSIILKDYSLKYKTAINGTLKPIDAEYGINPKIYDLTIRGFNEKGQAKFINNMFSNVLTDDEKLKVFPLRQIEEQKEELISLKNYSGNLDFKFTRVIISDSDKIIPAKNQFSFWGVEPNFKGGHCIFQEFQKWSELL